MRLFASGAGKTFRWHIFCCGTGDMKFVFLAVLCLLVSACAAAVSSKPEIYRIGELEVRLFKDRESLTQQLPPILSAVQAMSVGGAQVKVMGYFDRQNKRIYSLDDTRVLLHELKHYLDPDWKHNIGCVAPEKDAGSRAKQSLTEAARATLTASNYSPIRRCNLTHENAAGFLPGLSRSRAFQIY